MIDLPTLPANEVNTVLLVVGIPAVAWVGKKLTKAVNLLNDTVIKLQTVLLGTDGQGGLVRRVEQVASTGHDNANRLTEVAAEVEFLKEERRKPT